jgi:hypothetical protein
MAFSLPAALHASMPLTTYTAACLPAGLTSIPTGDQGVCCAYLLKNAADPKSWQLVCNRDINRVRRC